MKIRGSNERNVQAKGQRFSEKDWYNLQAQTDMP